MPRLMKPLALLGSLFTMMATGMHAPYQHSIKEKQRYVYDKTFDLSSKTWVDDTVKNFDSSLSIDTQLDRQDITYIEDKIKLIRIKSDTFLRTPHTTVHGHEKELKDL